MKNNHKDPEYSKIEIFFFLLIVIAGIAFTFFMYTRVKNENYRSALLVGKSIAAALPVNNIKDFNLDSTDLNKATYQTLKAFMQNVVNENHEIRFLYIYAKKNQSYYFLVDSENPKSPDYSPPGQQFTEIAEYDKKPFTEGKSIITPPLTDRWGTWISVLMPIKDEKTGKVHAVLGLDIAARNWYKNIIIVVAESSLLALLLIVLGIFFIRLRSKNKKLKKIYQKHLLAEQELKESEERYRLLYENASIGIYRTTPDGEILLANKALVSILGYTNAEELMQRNIEKGTFDPTYSRAEFKSRLEKEGEIIGLEEVWQLNNGKTIFVRENAKAVRNAQGKIVYYDGTIEDITTRKEAELALEYSETRFKQIAEQSREVVWEVNSKGLYTYVSPLSTTVLGYTPEELINTKHFYDLHPEETRDAFQKATLEYFSMKEKFSNFINEIVTGFGTRIWVTTNGVPIIDNKGKLVGYRGSDSDITERIQQEKQLRKLTLAIEQSPVSIVITDTNGLIEYGNPTACRSTGYTLEELTGKNPSILKSGFTKQSVYEDLWHTILAGKIWNGEFLNRRKNDELYWEKATIAPIFDNEGNIINFVAIKEDITPLKKIISELKEAKDLAESSDLLKSAFLKSITHEIRTPLNTIVGISKQIVGYELSEESKKQLVEVVDESSNRLISTVNNYLDISMLVSGNMVASIRKFDLIEVLHNLALKYEKTAKKKGLSLKLYTPQNVNQAIINADVDFYIKTLSHLLDNAIKFTSIGEIKFGFDLNNETITIFVKDSGIGISQHFLSNIFNSFVQEDSSDTRAYEGSGLGLTIASKLCFLLGSELMAESELNSGSNFHFSIPVNDVKLI